jgi:hypothetical protein
MSGLLGPASVASVTPASSCWPRDRPSATGRPVTRLARAVRLAFAFLTVFPLGSGDGEVTDADLAASRFAYPLVGGAIGLLLAGLSEALARIGTDRPWPRSCSWPRGSRSRGGCTSTAWPTPPTACSSGEAPRVGWPRCATRTSAASASRPWCSRCWAGSPPWRS